MTIEDTYLSIARKAQESWDKDTQAIDVFNEHIMTVVKLASPLDFRNYDHDERVSVSKKILGNLMVAMYAVRLLPPAEDDLKDMAEAMNVSVANDAVLCTALICRGASDALLFFHEADQVVDQDLIRSIGEALSGIYLLCNLLGVELPNLTAQL